MLLVERVDRLPALGARADGGVDLPRAEAGREHVARHAGAVERLERVIALVGDGDNLVVEPEREQQLGGRGHEGDDPHGRHDMELLSDEQIAERLSDSEWAREDDEIVREWKFENFGRAMEFVNAVAEVAEGANHHPDILLHGWNKVRLSVTNHSAGGLTEADFRLAGAVDGLA